MPVPAKEAELPATPPDLSGAKSVDDFVFGWLKHLGVAPAAPCSDEVFVRRVYLDVIGTLPTAAEARTFLTSTAPDKRGALVEQLLTREEFADRWALKWGDLLRIRAEFPINLWPNAAQAYHRWVRTSVAQNKPYDQFARELLTASGSNFRVGPANFYRAMQSRTPEGIAATVAPMTPKMQSLATASSETLASSTAGSRAKPTKCADRKSTRLNSSH